MQKNLRFSLLGLGIMSTVVAAVKMYSLPLWSWWTLLFLIGLWLSWLMLALPLYTKVEKGLRWLTLSSISGILLAAGFPTSPFIPLIFVAFVPLLIVVEEISESDIVNKKRILMRFTYNLFVIWNILATWWVGNAGLIPGMIANFLNAFFMCFPILAYFYTKRKLNENLAFLALICYWFSWEYLHLNWDLSWPWLTLGNAFATQTSWIQWYEYTGVFGGGLWILLVNILIFSILKDNSFSFKNIFSFRKKWVFGFSLLAIPIILSFFIGKNKNIAAGENSVEVVALQPNYEPHYEKFEVSDELQLSRYLQLSKANISKNTQYLILPETTFGYFDVEHLADYTPIKAFQTLTDSFPNLHIVSGFDLIKNYAPAENLPKTVRKRGYRYTEIYNGATQITHNQSTFPIYKKSKLVPGPEVLPFYFIFKWLKPLFTKMGGTIEGLGTQEERSLFWDEKGNGVAPVICYESIYGDYCADYIRHGAKALFVMTNDGWWDDTPGYQQHLDFARLRAIEFRVPVVRSANTGASAFINESGEIVSSTQYGVTTALKGNISLIKKSPTFYAKYGDYIAKIGVLLAFLLFGLSFFKKTNQ